MDYRLDSSTSLSAGGVIKIDIQNKAKKMLSRQGNVLHNILYN